MAGSEEVVGDIAAGALAARAIEPAHGEVGADGHTHEAACLNCGTVLVGPHCHGCGQAAHVHRTLGAFFHDLLHGVFHFEGKIWRTLPMLAWQPGRLTREYIDGRRASYVSPIALFLFSVFLMFAVMKQVSGPSPVEVKDAATAGLAQNEQELAALRQQRAELARAGKSTEAIDGEIAGRESAVEAMGEVGRELEATGISRANLSTDLPLLQHAATAFNTNPGLALYKLQNNAYKFSWALIPISVPFVWLLFAWRRRYGLYDHTVFVTYSLCFMTLLLTVLALGAAAGVPFLGMAALLVPPVHMYRQLRGTYALGRASALWRTWALLMISASALILFTVLLLAQTGA